MACSRRSTGRRPAPCRECQDGRAGGSQPSVAVAFGQRDKAFHRSARPPAFDLHTDVKAYCRRHAPSRAHRPRPRRLPRPAARPRREQRYRRQFRPDPRQPRRPPHRAGPGLPGLGRHAPRERPTGPGRTRRRLGRFRARGRTRTLRPPRILDGLTGRDPRRGPPPGRGHGARPVGRVRQGQPAPAPAGAHLAGAGRHGSPRARRLPGAARVERRMAGSAHRTGPHRPGRQHRPRAARRRRRPTPAPHRDRRARRPARALPPDADHRRARRPRGVGGAHRGTRHHPRGAQDHPRRRTRDSGRTARSLGDCRGAVPRERRPTRAPTALTPTRRRRPAAASRRPTAR